MMPLFPADVDCERRLDEIYDRTTNEVSCKSQIVTISSESEVLPHYKIEFRGAKFSWKQPFLSFRMFLGVSGYVEFDETKIRMVSQGIMINSLRLTFSET